MKYPRVHKVIQQMFTLEGWLSSAGIKSDTNGTSNAKVDHGFSVAYCETWNNTACHFHKQTMYKDQGNQYHTE